MIVTLPDRQLLEALTSHTPADRLGVELRIWDWNSPIRDVLGDEADDVVATVLPYFRPAPEWRSLADLPKLRLLQAQSAGYDNLLHITPDGVALANARGVHEASTSELAVGLMLAAQRELPRWARERRWQAASTRALADSRVLVVGTGAIGEAIRSRLAPFETEITRVATTARDDEHGHIHGIDELPELLPNTDILVLIVPLTDSTRGLIGAKELALLPDGALVVNVARGPVVDSKALADALKEGRIAGAGIDVFEGEPPIAGDHPLLHAPNVILAPHVGFATQEAMEKRAVIAFKNVQAYLAGKPQNVM